jgi:hypothetical protein
VQLTIALKNVLPEITPCDVTALLLHLGTAASCALEALVSFIKIPSAIQAFLNEVPANGCNGSQLAAGILAAVDAGQRNTEGRKAAGRQLHRQRQGAVMGPTVLGSKLLGGETTVSTKLVKAMSSFLQKVASKGALAVPGWCCKTHFTKYRAWLAHFCRCLGVSDDPESYVFLHIIRKHCIRQTYLEGVRSLPLPPTTSEAVTSFLCDGFSSKSWLRHCKREELIALVPDEGRFLSQLPGQVRPCQVANWAGVDILFLSCWFCLCKDLLDHAMCRGDKVRSFEKPWSLQGILDVVERKEAALIEAAKEHKKIVDGDVSVTPCVYNLLKPMLQMESAC